MIFGETKGSFLNMQISDAEAGGMGIFLYKISPPGGYETLKDTV